MTEKFRKSPRQLQGIGELLEALTVIIDVVKDPKSVAKYTKGLDQVDELFVKQEQAIADIKKNTVVAEKAEAVKADIEENKRILGEIKIKKSELDKQVSDYGPDLKRLAKDNETLKDGFKELEGDKNKFKTEKAEWKKKVEAEKAEFDKLVADYKIENAEKQRVLDEATADYKEKLSVLNKIG